MYLLRDYYAIYQSQELMPDASAPLGDDGRVLGGAVAGMGALEVKSCMIL